MERFVLREGSLPLSPTSPTRRAEGIDELHIVVALGGEGEAAGLITRMLQINPKVLGREHRYSSVGPLDDAYSAALDVVVKAELLGFDEPVDTVQVYVVEHEPASVLGRDNEGRAAYVGVDVEPMGDPLGEAGFAGAELAYEEDQVAGPGRPAKPLPEGLGLLRRVGFHGQRGVGWVALQRLYATLRYVSI